MSIFRHAINNMTGVLSGVILGAVIGAWSMFQLPIQLVPNVELYKITISTRWPAASPVEIEANILKPQEDVLKGMESMASMEASATQGIAIITLSFGLEADPQRVLIDVTNRLGRVPGYPPDVDQPEVVVGASANETAVAWLSVKPLADNPRSIVSYLGLIENVVQPAIERIPGVASTRVVGGQRRELRITFDPYKVAGQQLQLDDVASLLRQNRDISGGYFEVGRRQYALRLQSRYEPEQLEDLLIPRQDGGTLRLRDIADVDFALADAPGVYSENGGQSIAISVQPRRGINIIEMMDRIKSVTAELQRGILAANQLTINQTYDESIYVGDAINLVISNLILGILLAIGILWWFLRSAKSTLIISICIPLTLTITFAFLNIFDRTLNVISLAGMAFAVGLSLDAGIVVLENIHRHIAKGGKRKKAIVRATAQVRGALFASSATSVAVFLPIVYLKDIAGQLFADLALSIATSVVVSLVIALFVIPAAAAKFIVHRKIDDDRYAGLWQRLSDAIVRMTSRSRRRYIIISACILLPIIGSVVLLPSADYLPDGKQNQMFAFISPPPGLSLRSARKELTDIIDERLTPFLDGTRQPEVHNYWLGFYGRFGFLGATTKDPNELDELIHIVNTEALAGFPDIISFASRTSIFQRFGGGRFIDVNVQGPDVEQLLSAANQAYSVALKALPGAQIRPIPGLNLTEPEFLLTPDNRMLSDVHWSRRELGDAVRAFGDGLWLGEYFSGDERLDIVLRSDPWRTPEELLGMPVYTARGDVVALGDLVSYQRVSGPGTIRRFNGQRTVTLRVTPPNDVSIEEALTLLKTAIEPTIRPILPSPGDIIYQGTAEDLDLALANLGRSLIFAVLVLFLLMGSLFRSFRDASLVLLTIPLASIGGIAMLQLTNLLVFQPMDLLTIIGFIILVGLVVNNAILLVNQVRAGERDGMDRPAAVGQALRIRLRPIIMTTTTTIFGLVPLLVLPGAGAELYRGLAAVIVGGMLANTAFILLLIPSLLMWRSGVLIPIAQNMIGKDAQPNYR